MFFDTDVFIQFHKDCRAAGINCPIIPGIMLVTKYGGFKRMCGFCKTRVPPSVAERIEALKDDEEGLKAYGTEFAVEMSRRLIAHGSPVLHYYTLNFEKPVAAVLQQLGRWVDEEGKSES